jgi:transposase InsO family protein
MTFTDVWGPSRTRGIRGERYFITFTDGAKRYRKIVTMKKKSEAEQHVMDYTEFILTQTGKRCKGFRFDGGGEYLAKSLRDQLATKGIQIEPTAPYSPQQNGVSERLNRTILERTRAMLISHGLPDFLWPQAVIYATYIINRSPLASLKANITPHEAFWGDKPDVSRMQEFGTTCWVLLQGQKQSKIAAKSKPYHFVGMHVHGIITSRRHAKCLPHAISFSKHLLAIIPLSPRSRLTQYSSRGRGNQLTSLHQVSRSLRSQYHTHLRQSSQIHHLLSLKPTNHPRQHQRQSATFCKCLHVNLVS